MTAADAHLEVEVAALIEQRVEQLGPHFGFADHEVEAIRGNRFLVDDVNFALEFTAEHLGMHDVQAVSCNVCGGLFKDRLPVMRRHRLKCGWRQ